MPFGPSPTCVGMFGPFAGSSSPHATTDVAMAIEPRSTARRLLMIAAHRARRIPAHIDPHRTLVCRPRWKVLTLTGFSLRMLRNRVSTREDTLVGCGLATHD